MRDETVTINGQIYDKHTGVPVKTSGDSSASNAHSASLHHVVQKSTTLNRRYLKSAKKTTDKLPEVEASAKGASSNGTSVPVRTSIHKIQKFAEQAAKPARAGGVMDIGHVPHPIAKRVETKILAKRSPAERIPKPSSIIKAEAIQKALDTASSSHEKSHVRAHKQPKQRHARFLQVATACMALLLIGGYFTYINMPNVSVRIAAAQAGINANYPSYHPSGYSLSGPVAYNDGQVSMKFASNGSNQAYTVSQSRSGLDSTAVLDRFVKPEAGDNYTVTRSNGLTIYSYQGNAAWVNSGILYEVRGNAPLTNDQIQRIALSM